LNERSGAKREGGIVVATLENPETTEGGGAKKGWARKHAEAYKGKKTTSLSCGQHDPSGRTGKKI